MRKPGPHKRIVGEDRERATAEAVKAYRAGMSVRDIAANTNRSYGAVHRLLSEAGVDFRSRGGNTRKRGKAKAKES